MDNYELKEKLRLIYYYLEEGDTETALSLLESLISSINEV